MIKDSRRAQRPLSPVILGDPTPDAPVAMPLAFSIRAGGTPRMSLCIARGDGAIGQRALDAITAGATLLCARRFRLLPVGTAATSASGDLRHIEIEVSDDRQALAARLPGFLGTVLALTQSLGDAGELFHAWLSNDSACDALLGGCASVQPGGGAGGAALWRCRDGLDTDEAVSLVQLAHVLGQAPDATAGRTEGIRLLLAALSAPQSEAVTALLHDELMRALGHRIDQLDAGTLERLALVTVNLMSREPPDSPRSLAMAPLRNILIEALGENPRVPPGLLKALLELRLQALQREAQWVRDVTVHKDTRVYTTDWEQRQRSTARLREHGNCDVPTALALRQLFQRCLQDPGHQALAHWALRTLSGLSGQPAEEALRACQAEVDGLRLQGPAMARGEGPEQVARERLAAQGFGFQLNWNEAVQIALQPTPGSVFDAPVHGPGLMAFARVCDPAFARPVLQFLFEHRLELPAALGRELSAVYLQCLGDSAFDEILLPAQREDLVIQCLTLQERLAGGPEALALKTLGEQIGQHRLAGAQAVLAGLRLPPQLEPLRHLPRLSLLAHGSTRERERQAPAALALALDTIDQSTQDALTAHAILSAAHQRRGRTPTPDGGLPETGLPPSLLELTLASDDSLQGSLALPCAVWSAACALDAAVQLDSGETPSHDPLGGPSGLTPQTWAAIRSVQPAAPDRPALSLLESLLQAPAPLTPEVLERLTRAAAARLNVATQQALWPEPLATDPTLAQRADAQLTLCVGLALGLALAPGALRDRHLQRVLRMLLQRCMDEGHEVWAVAVLQHIARHHHGLPLVLVSDRDDVAGSRLVKALAQAVASRWPGEPGLSLSLALALLLVNPLIEHDGAGSLERVDTFLRHHSHQTEAMLVALAAVRTRIQTPDSSVNDPGSVFHSSSVEFARSLGLWAAGGLIGATVSVLLPVLGLFVSVLLVDGVLHRGPPDDDSRDLLNSSHGMALDLQDSISALSRSGIDTVMGLFKRGAWLLKKLTGDPLTDAQAVLLRGALRDLMDALRSRHFANGQAKPLEVLRLHHDLLERMEAHHLTL